MDPATTLFIFKFTVSIIKNLTIAADKAKANDGKISASELPELIYGAAVKTLDDLGAGSLSGLLGAAVKH